MTVRDVTKRALALLCAVAAALLSACGATGADTGGQSEDSFSVRLVCRSEDVYMIFYSCYVGGEYYGMGGVADYDHRELTDKSDLKIVFSRDYLSEAGDISDFAIDFSPYGRDDISEIGTTNRVHLAAEYGRVYTVVFSGDRESGFTAELTEQENREDN